MKLRFSDMLEVVQKRLDTLKAWQGGYANNLNLQLHDFYKAVEELKVHGDKFIKGDGTAIEYKRDAPGATGG